MLTSLLLAAETAKLGAAILVLVVSVVRLWMPWLVSQRRSVSFVLL